VRDPRADPTLGAFVATLRAFVARAGAERAVLLLDRGEGSSPLVLDVAAEGGVELDDGDEPIELGPADFAGAAPLELPDVRSLPPADVNAQIGQVTAPPGALEHQARAVRELAACLPGRSVLTVGFKTSDPEEPLFIAARDGEPAVLTFGEAQFELPDA
jgi:hypothetical protein